MTADFPNRVNITKAFSQSNNFTSFRHCSELPLLTLLDLSNNKISEIFEKNFFKSTLLQTLNVGRNRIAKIAPKSFEKLLMLKNLDISNNKLESLTVEMFGGNLFAANKLRKLNLSNNLIATLKVNLFALLVNLATLDVSGVSSVNKKMNILHHENFSRIN